jgi:glycosyltransferase involved in cell wall biosynthesis
MKKIIFTVTNDLTYDRRMLRICTSLAKAGYEVFLVGRKMDNSQAFENQYFKSKRFSLIFNKGKFFYVEYNIRLFIWLLFQRFDIICSIDLDTILPCFLVRILRGGNWLGKTMVYDAHELFTEVPEVIRRPTVRKIWLCLERFIVPKLKHCYTVSQSVADEFEQRYGVKFELIRNLPQRVTNVASASAEPVASDLSEPVKTASAVVNLTTTDKSVETGSDKSEATILYQGSLNEGRGLETALEAMHDIENAVLWLAGEGDLSEILRGMVKEQKLEKKVKFLGYILPEKLPEITAQAHIGIQMSEDKGLSYQLSLSNKFLDYIQAGVPQICTRFVEYERLNEQYNIAILIDKTDKHLLIQAVNRLLNDKTEYEKIKNNCLRAAQKLCWEEEEKRLIAFYNRL